MYQTFRVYGGLLEFFYKLNLVFDHDQEGADFFPFSLKTGVLNKYKLIATNPVSCKIYLIELSHLTKKQLLFAS